MQGHRVEFRIGDIRHRAAFARDGARLWLAFGGLTQSYEDLTYAPAAAAGDDGDGRLVAPMSGKILAVRTQAGAAVRKGDVLVVLEAMKMEFEIAADGDGIVQDIQCQTGQQVKARQLLVRIGASAAS